MIITKLSRTILFNTQYAMKFSGGHAHKVYDWRQDNAQNPDLYFNQGMVGVKPGCQYQSFPYMGSPKPQWQLSHPSDYDQKNLHTNLVSVHCYRIINNRYQPPQTVSLIDDIAHEWDYDSQDVDFQPQSFSYQHFRKQGPLYMWVFACTLPLWFYFNQFYGQMWADASLWRYQRPPPLDYPTQDDTPDTETAELFASQQYLDLYDAGIVIKPYFQIKDGKKIYSKWAGVNQPIPHI